MTDQHPADEYMTQRTDHERHLMRLYAVATRCNELRCNGRPGQDMPPEPYAADLIEWWSIDQTDRDTGRDLTIQLLERI
jgi:hypothetical protein